jgi:phosphoglycolate phosphatase-like HAD superfamily hydrolase
LFDIDGTLVRSRGSAEVFDDAMERVFGLRGGLGSIRPDGMTDPDILAALLDGREAPCGPMTPRLLASFEMELARSLAGAIARGRVAIWTLPGVPELLRALAARSDVCLGIVTGNLRSTARIKLDAAGIRSFFVTGGYGSDSPARTVLPGVALRRLARAAGRPFDPTRAVIVGDTPHDFRAAHANGMRCVLVSTGQYTRAELEAEPADELLDDLEDTERVLRAILEQVLEGSER